MAESSEEVTPGVGVRFWDGSSWAAVTTLQRLPVFTSLAESAGLVVERFVSSATNNKRIVWPLSARLHGISVQSIAGASSAYLKAYNENPTMGTTECFDQWCCPAASAGQGSGVALGWPAGIRFSSMIYVALTGGIALDDDTAVAASAYNVSIYYIGD